MKVSRFFEVRWVGPALVLVLVLVGAAVMQAFDANPAVSQSQQLVAGAAATDPGTDPSDSAWAGVSKVQVALNAQPGIYASGGGSIAELTAQALHYRGELFVRLEWADTTNDRTTVLPTDYSDAIAIEFPAKAASSVPSVCMGQADQGVNIWQWRADSQRGVDTIQAAFPNGYADWYPDESEDVWFPARAVENPFAETDGKAVQDLVARLFGTISPAATQTVDAQGSWGNGRWAVVFSRPFESPGIDQAEFDVDPDIQVIDDAVEEVGQLVRNYQAEQIVHSEALYRELAIRV